MNIYPHSCTLTDLKGLLASAVSPRPIAWISTLDRCNPGGWNLAPFSSCTPVSCRPPLIVIGASRREDGKQKDTILNIISNGEFVVNCLTRSLIGQMVATSGACGAEGDEFWRVGVTPQAAAVVSVPRIAECKIHIECRLFQHQEVGKEVADLVLGEVVCVHIEDSIASGNTFVDFGGLRGRQYVPLGALAIGYYLSERGVEYYPNPG